MNPPSSKRVPPRLLLGGVALVFIAAAGFLAVIPHVNPPIVEGPAPASFLGVVSAQTGGTFWLTMKTAKPVDVWKDSTVDLEFDIATDTPADTELILGGTAATSVRACDGTGVYVDPSDPTTGSRALAAADRDAVIQYEKRVPTTGYLYGSTLSDARSESEATKAASALRYRSVPLVFPLSDSRTWTDDQSSETTYPVRAARLTCSFDASGMIRSKDYVRSFSLPDFFARIADVDEQGPVQLEYTADFLNNSEAARPVNTFPSTRDHVDAQTGNRLLTASGTWWMRDSSGPEGVLISSGIAQFEPRDAAWWRTIARLGAGAVASFGVALLLIVIRKSLYYVLDPA